MKRARIGSVHVRGVRGVRETVKLELGERGLLLRGDNGTGKSSIVDGLRWALLGEMPPAKGEDFRTHLRAQGACEIAIDLTPRGKIVFRDGALDEEATTEEGLELVEHCRRSRPFLRRAELLDLLQGSASDRFQYLAKFFDLAAVDTLEQDLAKGTRERRTRMEELEREARRRLESIVAPIPWAQAGPDRVEDVDRHARAEGARLGLAREGESATISDLMVRAAASRGSGAQSRRRSELHAAATEADKLVPPDAPKTALEPLRSAESAATENGLQSLLESALAHLEHHPDRAACPVCEQATSPTDLATRLKARLALLSDVRNACTRMSSLADQWHGFLRALRQLESTAGQAISGEEPSRGRELLDRLDRVPNLSQKIRERLETVRTALRSQHDAIPNELRASEIDKLHACLERLERDRAELERNETERAQLATSTASLQTVASAVSTARKNLAEILLDELSDAAHAIYDGIHGTDPNDVTKSPRIKFTRHSKGLANLEGSFADQKVKEPALLYSDGHLDTVGIAYFLAVQKLRERENPNAPRILVLDDIVLSVDMTHARALVEVLTQQFSDYQLVIATHSQAFAEQCKALHLTRLSIRDWSLTAGPALVNHVPGRALLEEALKTTGDVATLAVATRPVLEALFKEACAHLSVRLPYEAPDLTFVDYWEALRPKLETLSSRAKLPDVRSLVVRLGDPLFLRNALGAHSNDWARDVPLKQAQLEAQTTLELLDALSCSTCGAMLRMANRRDEKAPLVCRCPRGTAPTTTLPFATKESS